MAQKAPPRVWRSGPFIPTVPRTGDEGESTTSWRKENLRTKGRNGRYYEENDTGLGDLQEDVDLVALTGTLALTADSPTVVGSGTLFLSEVHLGQFICAMDADQTFSFLLVPKQIVSDTEMIVWIVRPPDHPPWPTVDGLTGWQMPVMFSLNDSRGTALRGNVLKLDKGSFLGVGKGTFRINGQVLAGTSMTLSREPTIALYDPVLNSYTPFVLGMDTSVPPTLAAVGGGIKGMQGGNYSIVITPARKETDGYNNPSERADVTIVTNDMIACTFPAMDTANGQDAWIVWVTTFAATLGADLNYLNGPWFRLRMVDDTEVSPAGGTVNFEWLDAEVETNELVSFNNDRPVEAEFVEILNAIPVWISCQGQGFAAHPVATSPGPFIVPAKPNNIEAAPLELAFSSSPPETILGAVSAQGRIYLLTVNKLQIAQATPSDVVPILIRPFWHDGFAHPYQVVFVNGVLYGYPVAGPSRSVGDGDEQRAERDWAADVFEITKHWNNGQVLVGYDPYNDEVVFFHAADHLNEQGFWTTVSLSYGIPQQFWTCRNLYTNPTKDQIVCGLATVSDRLELIAGGRGSMT